MQERIENAILKEYRTFNIMGYEVSDQRAYLTFTCPEGTKVAVMVLNGDEVWIYDYNRRIKA